MFSENIYFVCLTAFLSGLLGSIHCIGMCGGIIIALSITLPKASYYKMYLYHSCYNFGRILSYSLIGFVAGFLGFVVFDLSKNEFFLIVKVIGGISLIGIGLYLGGVLSIFNFLEKVGWFFWLKISPYTKKFIPINNAWHAFIVGVLWGNVPCGLVYATLIWSLSFGSFIKSTLLMMIFGLGTLPVMFFSIFFMSNLRGILKKCLVRLAVCFIMLGAGTFTIINTIIYSRCH